MKRKATIVWMLSQLIAFATLQAQEAPGQRIFITETGLKGSPQTSGGYAGISVSGKLVANMGGYFLTQDITGNDYAFDLWCKTEPAGQTGTVTAEIKIGGDLVADTAFQVLGADLQLYHFSVRGADPNITGSAEVQFVLTIESGAEVFTSFIYGDFGEPQSSFVIPAPSGTVGVENGNIAQIPRQIELRQNYPNPFNPSTKISYFLAEAGFVTLKVYDLLGREVTTLVDGYQTPGDYAVDFDARNLAGGAYFYRLQVGNGVQTKKMILAR